MTGRGELPIGKMPGFEPPDDETHEIILERFKKQMRKETVSTVFWTIMSLFFIITYIVMYFRMDAKADAKKGILVALAAFVVIAVVTIYKYVFDKKADAIVNEKKYKVAPAMIHHIMPGFGTRLGKLTVKICDAGDDNVGNVYNYEFVINKKVSKAYRKNKDIILTVIEIDKQNELYNLTYIDETDKADKDAAEEDMEK